MPKRIEIRSTTVGEVDTFYHWLKKNRPELLKVPGIALERSEAGIMGMPGKMVLKIVYIPPDRVPAEVNEKLEDWKEAVEKFGGQLLLAEDYNDVRPSLLSRLSKMFGKR